MRPGERIGPYLLEEEIARGGHGVVFRARAANGQVLALKLLISGASERLARFQREWELARQLGPVEGYVPVLDAGRAPGGGAWLAMPYLPGGTLRDRLRRGPLGLEEALLLGQRLARALGRAHARGIVHRDLKPENVLFRADGQPQVADLGLARVFAGGGHSLGLSLTGEMRGTAGYMAPEQMSDAKAVGPPADVFSLGALLYECLTGEPAFASGSATEVLRRVASNLRDPLVAREPDLPAWLVAEVERALDPEPTRRHPDGDALAAALVAPGAVGAAAPARRGALAPIVGAISFAVLTVGSAWALRARSPAAAHTTGAPQPGGSAASVATDGEASTAPPQSEPLDELEEELPTGTTPAGRRARELVLRSRDRSHAGDLEGALAMAEEALTLDPQLTAAWVRRGYVRWLRGDAAGARADYDRALELRPDHARTLALRGDTWKRTDPQRAALDFARALALDPTQSGSRVSLAALQMGARSWVAARKLLLEGVQITPEEPLLWVHLSQCCYELQDLPGAIQAGERAVALQPQLTPMWRTLGRLHLERGDAARALQLYTRAIELAPREALLWSERAEVHTRLKHPRAALADLNRALELGGAERDVLTRRGNVYLSQGELVAALRDYDQALALDPAHLPTLLNRGWARALSGDLVGGTADVERATELAPDSAQAWLKRSAVLVAAKDVPRAREAATRAIELAPERADLWYQRAQVRGIAGEFAGAEGDVTRALELDPRLVEAWNVRAKLREDQGDVPGAVADLEHYLTLDPPLREASEARARLLRLRAPR